MKDPNKKYINWPTLALMGFVTVVGFDDLIYNFQNQGLSVIISWILMIILYVVPYSMMVGHLGSAFNHETGGLSSWVRGTNGDFMGYLTAWTHWAASIPYIVDTANTIVIGIGWLINGTANLQDQLSNSGFALLTLVVFIVFIYIQSKFKNSMEFLSKVGGIAMFSMTVLFVVMTFTALSMGGHIETEPITAKSLMPKFDFHYLTTIGLLIYGINGAESIAPFITKMRNPQKEFPKAMIMLAAMTGFLTIFGSFSLSVFFNAYHLPADLKMNGSYYAFQALGQHFHLGNIFMYIFALTEILYLSALLAVLLDAMTRMLISDTGSKYIPKVLQKTTASGLPINGYLLTCGLSAFIMMLGIFLPSMLDVFDWLLNLNGIISPGVTCWVFFAFIQVRRRSNEFPSDYTFIKNDKIAQAVGWWCLTITLAATIFGMGPKDVPSMSATWWYELIINIVAIASLVGLGAILPYLTKREDRSNKGAAFTQRQWIGITIALLATIVGDLYIGGTHARNSIWLMIVITVIGCTLIYLCGHKQYDLKEIEI